MDAARTLLARGGSFVDLSIEQIASEALVGRTAFYAHFPDKRELLLRMAHDASEPLFAQVDEAIGGRPSGPEGVREGLGVALGLLRQNAALFRAVVEASTYDEVVADFWQGGVDRLVAAVAARIEARRKAGPKIADARALATVLVSMVLHSAHRQVTTGTGVDDDELRDTLADVWIRAVYGGASRR